LKTLLLGGGTVDLHAEILGQPMEVPIVIGPTSLNGIVWPQADLHLAAASEEAGIAFAVSTATDTSIEEIAKRSPGSLWY
jgi:(S)-mandelate dehydrogenase